MEDLIESLIVIIFIGIAVAVKLTEAAKKRAAAKAFPPQAPRQPATDWFAPETLSEYDERRRKGEKVEPEILSPVTPPTKQKTETATTPTTPEISAYPGLLPEDLSAQDIERGIVLAAILGPPRSLAKWRRSQY